MSVRLVTGLTLELGSQMPLLEFRTFGESKPKWILWLAYNSKRDEGTYLILNDDGSIWRETILSEGGTNVVVITPPCVKVRKFNHE